MIQLDGLKILERNSNKIESLELNEARKMAKSYKIAMKQIRDQLLITPDNTFTEAKLESALRQIEQSLILLERRLKPQMQESFEAVSESGVEDAIRELNYFEKEFAGVAEPLPIEAILASTDKNNFLFNQYESSIENYSQTLRNTFQRQLGQSLLQKKTWSQAVWDLETITNQGEWQLARIVRTELHNIYNIGKMDGLLTTRKDYLPDLKKTLYNPMDARTGEDSKAIEQANLIVDLDKPFIFKFNNKVYKFMAPPNRPNDRAILIPYRDKYMLN